MSVGWICPKCGRVYAPLQFQCFICNEEQNAKGIKERVKMFLREAKENLTEDAITISCDQELASLPIVHCRKCDNIANFHWNGEKFIPVCDKCRRCGNCQHWHRKIYATKPPMENSGFCDSLGIELDNSFFCKWFEQG